MKQWLGVLVGCLLAGCAAAPPPVDDPPPPADDPPPPIDDPPPPADDPPLPQDAGQLRGDALATQLVGLWQGRAHVITDEGEAHDDDTTIALDADKDAKVESIFMMGSVDLHQDLAEGTWRVEDDRLLLMFSGAVLLFSGEVHDPPDSGVCVRVQSLDGASLVGRWVPWGEASGCAAGDGQPITLTRFRSPSDR